MNLNAPPRGLTLSLVSLLAFALPTFAGSWVTYAPTAGTANGKNHGLLLGEVGVRYQEELDQVGKINHTKQGAT